MIHFPTEILFLPGQNFVVKNKFQPSLNDPFTIIELEEEQNITIINSRLECYKGEYEIKEGWIYNGKIKNGFGSNDFKNGTIIYEGQWKNDEKDGFGQEIYKSGARYEGEFKNNYTCDLRIFSVCI